MANEYDIIRLYNPPHTCGDGRCDNSFMEFIYCVAVPAAVVLLLLMVLAIVMCCNSKSCKCKKKQQVDDGNDIQLENYNSIRRASVSLRYMSQHRETPLMGSRACSMTLDRSNRRNNRARDSCYSAPGTLQRQVRNRPVDQSGLSGSDDRNRPVDQSGLSGSDEMDNRAITLHHQRRSQLADTPNTPPPPAYSTHSDFPFLGTDLSSNRPASSQYDESPVHDYNGTQPLLFHRTNEQ
ncbi:uncharacterized protein LOC131943337 isoform X1 [Physella acuta]|uniref:uncharacterized protein LOC131943337 isoform X1 n=1 Tax=Physella acuta TaxID=109671 RepID=UPI0027DDF5AA|nr:uncharacterized protein LOC131943337 isoform X1 [Physella acuta]XP_059159383.1 uncharacterized protein LOC131943337 isoform X1 [Physella acuta]XP_059159384.1 uncharacterized protein LOC131943337 isoform X1 [Physella acuta]